MTQLGSSQLGKSRPCPGRETAGTAGAAGYWPGGSKSWAGRGHGPHLSEERVGSWAEAAPRGPSGGGLLALQPHWPPVPLSCPPEGVGQGPMACQAWLCKAGTPVSGRGSGTWPAEVPAWAWEPADTPGVWVGPPSPAHLGEAAEWVSVPYPTVGGGALREAPSNLQLPTEPENTHVPHEEAPILVHPRRWPESGSNSCVRPDGGWAGGGAAWRRQLGE